MVSGQWSAVSKISYILLIRKILLILSYWKRAASFECLRKLRGRYRRYHPRAQTTAISSSLGCRVGVYVPIGEGLGQELQHTHADSCDQEGYRKPGAIVIGPAGENLVRFALIANDQWRCAGRAGVGAVMGSKRLKAVVFQGDRKRELAQPEKVADYAKAFSKTHMKSPGAETYRTQGTPVMVAMMNSVGAFPAKYWQQGSCDHWERISAETFHKEHQVKPHACAKCFMACGRMTTVSKGRHKDLQLEGPEYETIYAFGGLCMVEEIDEIVYLNDLCDRLGIDTITAGNLCAFTMEAVLPSTRGRVALLSRLCPGQSGRPLGRIGRL